jgi:hypothetical protein
VWNGRKDGPAGAEIFEQFVGDLQVAAFAAGSYEHEGVTAKHARQCCPMVALAENRDPRCNTFLFDQGPEGSSLILRWSQKYDPNSLCNVRRHRDQSPDCGKKLMRAPRTIELAAVQEHELVAGSQWGCSDVAPQVEIDTVHDRHSLGSNGWLAGTQCRSHGGGVADNPRRAAQNQAF